MHDANEVVLIAEATALPRKRELPAGLCRIVSHVVVGNHAKVQRVIQKLTGERESLLAVAILIKENAVALEAIFAAHCEGTAFDFKTVSIGQPNERGEAG